MEGFVGAWYPGREVPIELVIFGCAVVTLLLAGHETTANALSWAWVQLSRHPDVAQKLEAELATVLGDRPPTLEDIPALVYTRQVLDEVMRLYPPAWTIARSPTEDDELGGYFIPKGSLVFVSPWVVQRHPALFPNPEGFDPERLDKDALLAPDILPTFSVETFTAKGAVLDGVALNHKGPLALVELQNGDAPPSYVAGTENFYAITRYNWSSYYAMAVIELGREVAAAMPAASIAAR